MMRDCRQNPVPGPLSRLGRVPRPAASLLALALCCAAASLVACGEEDAQLLPGATAREITANLDAVEQLADEGDCAGAESAAQQVSEQVEALTGVDPRLKQALEEGAARLNEVVVECEEVTTEAIDPATIPPEAESEEDQRPRDEDGEDGEDEEEEESSGGKADAEEAQVPPPLPPQAEGEAKGRPPAEGELPEESDEGGEGSPSGGVSPGSPVEGDD